MLEEEPESYSIAAGKNEEYKWFDDVMSKFGKGDKVKNSITNEIGYIIEVHPPRRGSELKITIMTIIQSI